MSKKFPWLKLQKKAAPDMPLETPIWFGNRTNGEFWHDATPKEQLTRKLILERSEQEAKYHGMDRREFLASSAGMLTTLAVMNELSGCKEDGSTGRTMDGGDDGGGLPMVPENSPYVKAVEAGCSGADVLSGDEFIFDVQTHSFDDGEWREKNNSYALFLPSLVDPNCTEKNKLDCFNKDHYAELMFLESDTTMSVITSWPAATCTKKMTNACGLPLSNAGMRDLRDWLNQKAQSQRVINQVQIMPNDDIELQKDIMTMAVEDAEWRAGSWKAYPAWKSETWRPSGGDPEGYFLTDKIGRQFIEHGLKLGIHNFAIHKGLPIPGFDIEHNKPTDIGPTAKMYKEANIVVYHSGISSGCGFGDYGCGGAAKEMRPFDPTNDSPVGLDMLIKSLWDHDLTSEDGPAKKLNVYAELGSAWSNVMRNTSAAQHFMGKLLKYFGEDNIVWGTDAILGGSPQDQIQLFRTFEITQEYQDMFGYPAMTATAKAKIFGKNAARLYRVDPEAERCKLTKDALALRKQYLDAEFGDRRFTQITPSGPRTKREFIDAALKAIKKGHPGLS